MNSTLEIDPNRIHIFHELKKRRIYVGELIYDEKRDVYELRYDENYVNSRNAIPIGPELDLFKTVHTSSKGQLFSVFLDRIPEKSNPAYKDYCLSQGISLDEQNPLILLGSIGRRGPSSFIFAKVYKNEFSADDIIKMRKELGITQNDLATAFGIKKVTLQRIESGTGSDLNTIKLLQIYFHFPDVALWQLQQTGTKLHDLVVLSLIGYFTSKKMIDGL